MAKNKKRVKTSKNKTYKNKPVFEYYICTCEKTKEDCIFLKQIKNVYGDYIVKNEIFFATKMIDSNSHADFVNGVYEGVMYFQTLTNLLASFLFLYENVGDDFFKAMDDLYKEELDKGEVIDEITKRPLYRFCLFENKDIFVLKRNILNDKFTYVEYNEIERLFNNILEDFMSCAVYLSLENENKQLPTYEETVKEFTGIES